ncbi:MAG TPA: aminopeptidase N, partial [Campylobacterales bacterium]|nr:aminopeptidase N [Campylobacterales bacterium]
MSRKKTYLKDYKPLNFDLESIFLEFQLDREKTEVLSKMEFRNFQEEELILYCEDLELGDIRLNGEKVEYEQGEGFIKFQNLPREFSLTIYSTIYPSKNSQLEGLYISGDILVTHNEPEGFRRITPFPDRPDVMTKFTTKLIADKEEFPILLSNGNPISSGDLDDKKHFAIWEDPFKKPSYLFAVVAGKLDLLQDRYTTSSGREIELRIYTDVGKSQQAFFAMESLKNAMRWDEERFGLEYDLDIYMVVAVDSFNMGAMENKGLNIFNSSYLLADEETATDSDYLAIESVIAHEYFHNWTGNRVTCRDWFQLSLKEGLTVFRDQLFSADMRDPTIQRVQDVERLRKYQFPEDASPNAHPVQPKEYLEINNFYTWTVYEKGAEVIRMIHTVLGEEPFQKGMKLYFERHDGQAVTIEDFLKAMADANGIDLSKFSLWFHEVGTPHLKIREHFSEGLYSLKIEKDKEAETPLQFTLYNRNGTVIDSFGILFSNSFNLEIKTISKPILSLNQNFSAPIKHNYIPSLEDTIFLVQNDIDLFNRYEAVQSIYMESILTGEFESSLKVFDIVLRSDVNDYLKSYMLKLPEIATVFDKFKENIPIKEIYSKVEELRDKIGEVFEDDLLELFESRRGTERLDLSIEAMGKRALKNRVLYYLNSKELGEFDYNDAKTMTEKLQALRIARSEKLFEDFLSKYRDNQKMVIEYFKIVAEDVRENPVLKIEELLKSPMFDYKIPNLVRGLLGSFGRNYLYLFTKSGIELFVRELQKIDSINP